ncbi:MAG: O-antigen ligase family protein [Acidobacteriota bacterium]|nr:O-antigen ligase family protein [Acidobacteriota bacterium]
MRALANHSPTESKLDIATHLALLGFVGALQVSIAAAGILLTVTLGLWVTGLITTRERPTAPPFFLALLAYAGATLVSVAFSLDWRVSLVDAREVVLFLVVPLVYRLARGQRADTVASVIVTVGGVMAVIGVVQYGILEYDNLGRRPMGTMGHYMTYSGLLVLALSLAGARVLFDRKHRVWSALVMPALLVALIATQTRSYMVGAGAAIGLLCVLKDMRLLAVGPVLLALVLALAPPQITARIYSTFDMQDPTVRDRFAMGRTGVRIMQDHAWTGVGPDMVQEVYPAYRDAEAVEAVNPHLHNVPIQIGAERGLPALVIWISFVVWAIRDLIPRLKEPSTRPLAAAGLAAMVAMLTGGAFEYNFGDSEFLMLLLVLLTLPHAAGFRTPHPDDAHA